MTCPADDHGHERLRLELMAAGRDLLAAAEAQAEAGTAADVAAARVGLEQFCATHLLPQLRRDEACLQEAGQYAQTRLLAEAMRAEVRAITAIADELAAPSASWAAVAATRALHSTLAVYAHHHALLSSALTDLAGSARG